MRPVSQSNEYHIHLFLLFSFHNNYFFIYFQDGVVVEKRKKKEKMNQNRHCL